MIDKVSWFFFEIINEIELLMVYNLGLRLKQEPIDEWSTQEKLVLASGVQKIGNQNW